MSEQSGVVTEIRSVDFAGTPLWSFRLGEEPTWYRIGKINPAEAGIAEGSPVTFIHRNLQVHVPSIVPSGAVTEVVVPSAGVSSPNSGRSVGSAPSVKDGSEVAKRIQWQNARADATRIIAAALSLETIVDAKGVKGVLPWATNIAKAKKLDLLTSYINEMTRAFIEEENNAS